MRARAAVLFVLLALVLAPGARGAEGKAYEFRQNYRDGQEFNILFSQSVQVKAKLHAHGTVVQTFESVDATQDKGVLKVMHTADGVPTVEEVTLDPSCGEFHQQTGQPPRQSFTTMAGKKVTVQREPTGDIYVEVNGSRDSKLSSQLHNWLDRDANLYPDRPVRVKDKWDLSRKFGRVLNATRGQEITAFCQLRSVTSVKGREFAELVVSCAMTGTLMGSMQTQTQMEGKAWVDLATGRVAKLDMAGEVSVSGTMVVNLAGSNTPANVIGSGRFEYHQLCVATKHKDSVSPPE